MDEAPLRHAEQRDETLAYQFKRISIVGVLHSMASGAVKDMPLS